MEKERGHAAWTCVDVGANAADGTCDARLVVVLTPEMPHNRVTKMTPDVLFVDVGATKKGGRANVELLGFVASLLGLEESRVTLESGKGDKDRNKVLALSGLKQGKRELIWALQGKVGERHDPHFAADKANAARRLANEDAVKRRRELNEFQTLREEAQRLPQKTLEMPVRLGELAHTTGPLPATLRVKRKAAGEKPCENGVGPTGQSGDVHSGGSQERGHEGAESPDKLRRAGAAYDVARQRTAGAALAAYNSEESEDEDEDERPGLPQPFL